jgi:hypothetical protein
MPDKCLDTTLKQAMTTSSQSLSNISFTNFTIQHYIENNESKADRTSMDNDRLWEVIKVFKCLKNIPPIL